MSHAIALTGADDLSVGADIDLGALAPASGVPWRLKPADAGLADDIAKVAGVSPLLARILAGRDVGAEDAGAYLNPSLKRDLPDPSLLKDMDAAVDRLAAAVSAGETIGVFGDYDVDGTTATAILKTYFDWIEAGLIAHLPDRMTEGYGPSAAAFESLKERGAKLIVTVDCGAAADGAVAAAADLGIDVIVVDHHQVAGRGPEKALAVVNPHRADDRSRLTDMSAAGLAFLLVVALNRRLRTDGFFETRREPDIRGLLDLAALGLVCDVMPMTGLARTIVAQGLKVLSAGADGPANKGLLALAEAAGAKAPYDSYALGFQLGPRINAAGRIGHADIAYGLLTTEDSEKRRALADRLHTLNAARQDIEASVQADAIARIERDRLHNGAVIVVAGEGWHPGVVGIVAGRLKDRYGKPTIVIGVDDQGLGKGSGRSVSGVDLGAAVAGARRDGQLISGGGHAMAAGLTLTSDQLAAFADRLSTELAGPVERARAMRRREIDAVVALSAVTRATVNDIARAGPFGPGNPEPVFLISDVAPLSARPVGAAHLALSLTDGAGETARAIAFRAVGEPLGDLLSNSSRIHVVARIKADDWRGPAAAQLDVIDAAPA